jgi:hypothetical protein
MKTFPDIFHDAETDISPPAAWSSTTGKANVLIENPDGGALWAHAETLREAGYDYAVCRGPSTAPERRHAHGYFDEPSVSERGLNAHTCPMLTGGRCPLAEEADVVVTSGRLPRSSELVFAHRIVGSVVVLEPEGAGASDDSRMPGVTMLESPITEERLLQAVEASLENR